MSSIGVVGVIVDARNANVQWKIPDNRDLRWMFRPYISPKFNFLNRSWCLKFYANGDENNMNYFNVHLVLTCSTQHPLNLKFCLNLSLDNMDNASHIKHRMKTATHTFSKDYNEDDRIYVWGDVLESRSVWTNEPNSSAITISCFATELSLPIFTFYPSMCRKTKVSEDLKKIYDEKKDTDVTFTVREDTYRAHKLILATRSPEFKALFERNRNVSVFKIKFCDRGIFELLLQFLYTGTLEELPLEKIQSLHQLALIYCKDLVAVCERCMAHRINEDI